MSINFKTTLLLILTPFLIFWGWQVGIGLAGLLFGSGTELFIVAPSHFGWYIAALILVSLKLIAITANSARLWVFNWISDDQANN
ncbi:hypothetical protein [Marinobacter sp. ELB17]|uniref:hypothetical protein n=1 Tax=Marinobacter sp. ELB17 TaxID=270374 RepID=UPI0000F361C0|nr:hypothetical protein [Marinobacter sp. ELB17]EAZ97658.1 hypothetical protein MELB17_24037 [Marinobacter sp. ELB17]EAZ97679.1 hypothetical protein MELB17_24142 [Marinobacter sp. ELB17]